MPHRAASLKPLYIDTPAAAERFFASLPTKGSIALDTEGASFHRYVDRIYLLQVTAPGVTAVLDPLAIGAPAVMGEVLRSRDVEVVLHDADYDLRLLHQDYGWHVANIFDTRVAAQLLGIKAFGLAALLERYFGVTLDKKFQRADWSERPLSAGMLEYAALDTAHLLDLKDRMRADLERAKRWPWAAEEFERLEGTQWEPDDPALAFMRLKGARDLSRRELAVLREVTLFRDAVARELDRATFRVMGNEVLFELARRAPTTAAELGAIKGMPRGLVERRAREILDAVARGRDVPEDQLPKFPRAPRWDRDPDFDARASRLKAVRDEAAAQLDLDPGVLMSRDRLESIARAKPATREELTAVPGIRRWQVEVMGDRLLRAVKG
ncbi:MAG TPA: ribonuclease D [Gemmatimonadaceae bacterium]|nr:ribonuclease D [Gemmatimonadaceae bacterium]